MSPPQRDAALVSFLYQCLFGPVKLPARCSTEEIQRNGKQTATASTPQVRYCRTTHHIVTFCMRVLLCVVFLAFQLGVYSWSGTRGLQLGVQHAAQCSKESRRPV